MGDGATCLQGEPMSTITGWPGLRTDASRRRGARAGDLSVAVGNTTLELISDAANQFERWTGRPTIVVDAPHEVYLTDPSVLTHVVTSRSGRHGP